jgi:hypothetical protein
VTARRAALLVVALAAWPACDNACLAQSDLFAGLRGDLIEECCLCLAFSGTRYPGAACGEAFLLADGGIVVPPDSGPFIPLDAEFVADDLNRHVDPDEVPCLCTLSANQCIAGLNAGAPIVVTGACVSQGVELFDEAPCESSCRGVLTFDPLSTR